MLENYLPILIFLGVGVAIGIIPMLIGRILGPHRPDSEKLSAYECGFEAFEDSRMNAFLFPWGVVLREPSVGIFGFLAMVLFLGILIVGFIYEWKKGALEWE
jgi:NADH-quinone oxidoreductase subunit A